MRITGQLLKSERVNRGLTVQQVANALKLNQKIISAIEAGDTAQLPAKTFLRGFVKSYAEYLKLDHEAVLRQFQEEMGSTSPLPKVPPPPPSGKPEDIRAARPALRQTSQTHNQRQQTQSVTSDAIRQQNIEEQNINSKIIYSLIAAVAGILLIVAGTRMFDTGSNLNPVSNAEIESTNVIIPKFDGLDANVASATTDVAASATTSTAASATTAIPSPQETPTVTINEEDITPSPGKPIELVLEAKKDIEVFYAKGNTKQFKPLKLSANRLQIIRSPSGLHLKASDGSLFKITANGVELGNAGPNNKPVKLTF